jgi:hypothetical protein
MMNEKIKLEYLAGMCPVQAEGTIEGHRFYFRSRGSHWRCEVYEIPPAEMTEEELSQWEWKHIAFQRSGYVGPWPEAGWLDTKVATAHIENSLNEFLAGKRDIKHCSCEEECGDVQC